MAIRNWLKRWVIWMWLIARDLPEMGDQAAFMYNIWLALTSVMLIIAVVGPFMVQDIALLLISVPVALLVYFLVGLMVYFSNPNTNANVPWHKNGAW